MPLGSSSAAPVMSPGPSRSRKVLTRLIMGRSPTTDKANVSVGACGRRSIAAAGALELRRPLVHAWRFPIRRARSSRSPHPMRPTGTVTFLFTDIEGSTRLLADIGDGRYGELLEQHRALLREACARH